MPTLPSNLMRKKNFRKWWKLLGFRQELRNLEKEKLAAQELLNNEVDIYTELDRESVVRHWCSFCEDCGDCHLCW